MVEAAICGMQGDRKSLDTLLFVIDVKLRACGVASTPEQTVHHVVKHLSQPPHCMPQDRPRSLPLIKEESYLVFWLARAHSHQPT
jgi:hypothetical protein